ncbi:PTS sugar transporter subunit IIA [Sandarakinorhabdus sp.]|uniref:PTS sugar transporter subunit IIA n=1 Tax=Sandarakinorhabdus sp. TaxID=1916663 RepID=UPI00286E9C49|nr:PTS sugar transporter subunit IIA [Sandarakinorhabdus sp.]
MNAVSQAFGQTSGFAGLVAAGGVIPQLPALSKEAALLALGRLAADLVGQSALIIHERLRTREALGPTGFGGGVAIPHARLAGLSACVALVARLPQPIDWGAVDGQPVDLLVLLLSPETAGADHLKALARISRALRDPEMVPALRAADTEAAMLAALAARTTVAA